MIDIASIAIARYATLDNSPSHCYYDANKTARCNVTSKAAGLTNQPGPPVAWLTGNYTRC